MNEHSGKHEMMHGGFAEEGLDDPGATPGNRTGETSITRTCWVVFWTNISLALFKTAFGALGYSPLLIIDGLNSAAIAVVITTIILGIKMSDPQNLTKGYSYGKGKAQFLVALLAGAFLAMAGTVILGLSIKTFLNPISLEPVAIGLAVALISIIANVMLILYLRHIGSSSNKMEFQKIGRLQALSIAASIVVAQSFILIWYGWSLGERIGRLSISLIAIWLSILIIKNSLDGIMDRRSGEEIESVIKELAGSVDKVEDVRWVRTRRIGQNVCIDLQVALDHECTIRQSDQVAARIKKLLSLKMEQPFNVIKVEFCTV